MICLRDKYTDMKPCKKYPTPHRISIYYPTPHHMLRLFTIIFRALIIAVSKPFKKPTVTYPLNSDLDCYFFIVVVRISLNNDLKTPND